MTAGKGARAGPGPMRGGILIVDDHPIVARGLAEVLGQQPGLRVCGIVHDAHAALLAVKERSPDMAVVDISLKGDDGIELVKRIRARRHKLPILILSMHDESVYAERALRAGAQGYIMKEALTANLVRAVRRVLKGDIFLSDAVRSDIMRRQVGIGLGTARPGASPIQARSDREMEIFRLIGRGRGTREIADTLHRSVKTVQSHRENIKKKLGLRGSAELVRLAVEWGLVEQRRRGRARGGS
ncbi:MAG: response regulator transcription factor [Elusimicrobiota bacterium]